MPDTEQQLKTALKDGTLSPVYLLYGEEPYLVAHYASMIAQKAVPTDDMEAFNLHILDGGALSAEELEACTQALPLMGEHTCVWVKNYDPGAASPTATDRIKALITAVTEPCVLLFSVTAFVPDTKKNAKWKAFITLCGKCGTVVDFPHKSAADIGRLLCRGAAKRGCTLSSATAAKMTEQCGCDLFLLLNELDKLCAVVGEGGTITDDIVAQAAVRQLDVSIYELSKALLNRRYDRAYDCIYRLFAGGEKPIRVLSVMSEAYIDLYRAKIAGIAGMPVDRLAQDFGYRGREFRLRNAARDSRSLSLSVLRDSLELLATADTRMKSGSAERHRLILEETVAQLIVRAKMG